MRRPRERCKATLWCCGPLGNTVGRAGVGRLVEPTPRVPLSVRFPALYTPTVWLRRAARWARWLMDGRTHCRDRSWQPLPFRARTYSSRLIRPHTECPRWLQENKVTNLDVAMRSLDGVLIAPGEVFSFCRVVGLPTRRRGFVEGLELDRGRPRPGVGGGICQLANMIHWLVLHSPLRVLERSTHSVDPFPDVGRSIPFGTGASIFYNYVDLVIDNPTTTTFQLLFRRSEAELTGDLRASDPLDRAYSVFERHHAFVREGRDVVRKNEIWRTVRDRRTGARLTEELVKTNRAVVIYAVDPERLTDAARTTLPRRAE